MFSALWGFISALFSGGWGKFLLAAAGAAVFFVMQARFSALEKRYEEQGQFVRVLREKNAGQQESIAALLLERERSEQKLLAFERERKKLQTAFRQKRQSLRTAGGVSAKEWKEQEIPAEILAVLRKESSEDADRSAK